MLIREATDADWPAIYPFVAEIVSAGESYAFPEGLSLEEARGWWMERPPAQTFVAVEADLVLGSAKAGPNRPGRGAHVATASFMVDRGTQARASGGRSASTCSPGPPTRATAACSSTPWSRPTRSPCVSGGLSASA